jgi:hypothetical protein
VGLPLRTARIHGIDIDIEWLKDVPEALSATFG